MVHLRTGRSDIYYSKNKKKKSKSIVVSTRPLNEIKERVIATIFCDNMTLIITNTCPPDRARLAVSCLDRRGPAYVEQTGISDKFTLEIPKFSAFIGQLGRCGR